MQVLTKAFLLLPLLLQVLPDKGQEVKNCEKGSEIVLMPHERVETEVVWKKGNNKVAEWEVGLDLRVYPAYVERFKLEISGKLTITNITKEDAGDYAVEVLIPKENQYRTEYFKLNVFQRLKEPLVTCKQENGFIILTCNETSSADVEYSWKNNIGELILPTDIYTQLDDNNMILNVSLANDPPEELVCVVQNPVSEKNKTISFSDCLTSDKEHVKTSRLKTGLIVSMTVIALLVVGVSAALYFTGGDKVAKKKNNVKPNPEVYRVTNESVDVEAEKWQASEEAEIATTNSTDEQKVLLISNQQEDNHTDHFPILNNDPSHSSPGEARDATDATSKLSYEEIAKPEVESSARTATENQTNLPTSQEKDEDALSGPMDEPKNEKSSDADPSTGDGPK